MYYLLKWIHFSGKKNQNIRKILPKSGNSVNPEKWEPCEIISLYASISNECESNGAFTN